jgi:hypothetical protein
MIEFHDIKRLEKGFPNSAVELISGGLLIPKPTNSGPHLSLNPQKKAEIDRIIKEVLGEEPSP